MEDDKDRISPGAKFYMRLVTFRLDGSLDLNGEANVGGMKVEDALEPLKEDVQEYGDTGYIYECRPIIKVMRPNIRIIDLRKKRNIK